MKALSEATGTPLCWVQPKTFDRWFELRAGDDLIATLGWHTSCGSLAAAESADGRWTFKRVGFLNPRVTIREAGSELDLAVFWPRWLGDGSLEFAYRRTFRWQATDFWGTHWCFTDADGTPLVAFKPGAEKARLSDLFKNQAMVEIHPQGRDARELPILVLLGWYLMILRQEDAAAAAAAASAAAS
ncbi:MAG: hypothetical protein AMJ93_05565 [Anaerolineae bacterium SM23_84]|nr:MAG: hypothetical protein AMJ93_05565 [Anaerolineae bacterium SM23_84]